MRGVRDISLPAIAQNMLGGGQMGSGDYLLSQDLVRVRLRPILENTFYPFDDM